MRQHVDKMLNINRREAERAMSRLAMVRIGIVSAYDPSNYAAKVLIQPEGTETGWMPVHSPWVGNGWGLFCPPTPGDVVEVHYQEGGKGAPFISLREYGDQSRPLGVPSGEFWVVHKSGSFLKFHNDGTVEMNSQADMSITAPTVNLTGNLSVTGNILAGGDITDINDGGGTLAGLRTAYNDHVHGGVENGSGSTSTTDLPVT
jgi:phage baseplate assembly protein gpV